MVTTSKTRFYIIFGDPIIYHVLFTALLEIFPFPIVTSLLSSPQWLLLSSAQALVGLRLLAGPINVRLREVGRF